MSLEPESVGYYDSNWGDRLILSFENATLLDGVVFRRADDHTTWKVFSTGKWFNLNAEDGLPYESYDAEADEYSDEMTAEDVLEHPRVQGFQETHVGDDYFYEPVGVVVEENETVAVNDDIVGEEYGLSEAQAEQARDETEIPVRDGNATMLCANRAWVRTFAKKTTTSGEAAISDEQTYEDYGWLADTQPEFRPELVGRTLEMWIGEQPVPDEADTDQDTFTAPNIIDSKTGVQVTIENGLEESEPESEPEPEEATTAADGGAVAEAEQGGSSSPSPLPSSSENPSETDEIVDGNVPDVLDDLLDYFIKRGETVDADTLRDFAEEKVDDPDAVDWESAAMQVNEQS